MKRLRASSIDDMRSQLAAELRVDASDIVIEPRTPRVFRWAQCGGTAHGRATLAETEQGPRLDVELVHGTREFR